MTQPGSPVPPAQRPNRRRIWIALGVLGNARNVSIWRLSAGSASSEQVVMIKNFHFNSSANAPGVTYAPAANGIETRLVISATREPRSWLDFFGRERQQSDDRSTPVDAGDIGVY
jgi:hypothetical protein